MESYQGRIRTIVATMGRLGTKPHLVEGWMRLEHGCLDGLTDAQFRSEVASACECIDADPEASERLAESFGLRG